MGAESLMIIGGQWGDEGKGKVVDLLSSGFAAVVRYNGGNNAGHTVRFADGSSPSTSCPPASSMTESPAISDRGWWLTRRAWSLKWKPSLMRV